MLKKKQTATALCSRRVLDGKAHNARLKPGGHKQNFGGQKVNAGIQGRSVGQRQARSATGESRMPGKQKRPGRECVASWTLKTDAVWLKAGKWGCHYQTTGIRYVYVLQGGGDETAGAKTRWVDTVERKGTWSEIWKTKTQRMKLFQAVYVCLDDQVLKSIAETISGEPWTMNHGS